MLALRHRSTALVLAYTGLLACVSPAPEAASLPAASPAALAPEASCPDPVWFCGRAWPASTTELHCNETAQTTLAGIECLVQLERLDLEDAQISDLGPLRGLSELRWIQLEGAPVTALEPLAGLAKLEALDLSHTQVQDLGPLAELPSLTHLGLRFSPVSSIAPLARLPKLAYLDLTRTRVEDLGPLMGLSSLQDLELSSTEFDIAQLEALQAAQPQLDLALD